MNKNLSFPQPVFLVLAFLLTGSFAYSGPVERSSHSKGGLALFQDTTWHDPDFSLEATHNPTTITIKLTDRSHLDATYEIHGTNSFHFINEADSGQTYTFIDEGNDFVPGHTYSYFVDAFLHDGTHLPNVAGGNITTPLDVPAFGPWREPFDERVIRFNTMNAAGSTVEVYRSASADSGFVQIGTSDAFGEFSDTDVTPGKGYWYMLRGVKDGHEPSEFSEPRRYTAGSRNYNPELSYRIVNETTVEVSLTDHDFVDTEYYISYSIEGRGSGTHHFSLPDSGKTVTVAHENVPPGTDFAYDVTEFVNVHADANISNVATLMFTTPAASCENTGGMEWEVWTMVPGTSVSDIPIGTPPDEVNTITTLETPQFYANEYGARIRGYLCAPESGEYFFRIASDDNSELWLSTDENPGNKQRIAHVRGYTAPRQWNKYMEQLSDGIMLQAGNRYYIEVLHKEGGGNDDVAVAWNLPSEAFEGTPIPGEYMIPFEAVTPLCENAGTIVREIWTGIGGTDISAVPFNTSPDHIETYTSFETPQYYANNYGSRMRGYVCVPQTGYYLFWVSGDDNTELWLSTDESPAHATRIAHVPGYTGFRQWTKYMTQEAEVYLEAGRKYYIEARHKEAGGNDHISVGWQLPDGTMERPIPGSRLIEFEETGPVACSGAGNVYRELWMDIPGYSIGDVPTQTPPDRIVELSSLATPNYYANEYASRIRGYFCAPEAGEYVFWLTGDDMAELWLSTDSEPANKTLIAAIFGHTGFQEWDHDRASMSVPITLAGGEPYYFEVLHKEGGGADHVAVGWQLPSGELERPIPGNRLVPFTDEEMQAQLAETGTWVESPGVIQLFPNPATHREIQVSFSHEDPEVFNRSRIEVIDFTGEVVHAQTLSCESGCSGAVLSLDERVTPGIYLVKIRSGDVEYTEKLVIK